MPSEPCRTIASRETYLMHAAASNLSPIDWLMPRAYVEQTLLFPTASPDVVRELQRGLTGLASELPYLLSGVVDQDHPKGSVRLSRPYQVVDELLSWQDLSESLSYAALEADDFSPAVLSGHGIRPSGKTPPLMGDPEPVFRATVTIVKGGFLLCMLFHHSTIDISGVHTLLKLWAAYCRTGSADGLGFNSGWTDRSGLWEAAVAADGKDTVTAARLQLFASAPALVPVNQQQQQQTGVPQPGTGGLPSPTVCYKTCVFSFATRHLRQLKALITDCLLATDYGGGDSDGNDSHDESSADAMRVAWVSTGDVLAALLWSATVWAESGPQGLTPGFAFARIPVNIRSRLQPPLVGDYLGAAVLMTTASVPRDTLLSLSGPISDKKLADRSIAGEDSTSLTALVRICVAVRAAISRVTDDRIREALAYTASQAAVEHLRLSPHHNGISLVSWASEDVYGLDWGDVLGRCTALRILNVEGKRYPIVLPQKPLHDKIEVVASFDQSMMGRFRENWLIKTYGAGD